VATLLIWAAVSGGMTALRDVFRSSSLCQGGGRIYPQARPGPLCQDQVRHRGQPLLVELEG
jgi:hypothetical protein